MRILHICSSLEAEWGGVAKAVNGLTQGLAKKGLDISIFAPLKGSSDMASSNGDGVKIVRFPEGTLSRFWKGYSWPLAGALEKEVPGFDLVHIHGIWHYPNFCAYQAARSANKPFLVTIHGKLAPWCLNYKAFKKNLYAGLIQRRILEEASAIHAITEEEGRDISGFVDNKNIFCLTNGLNVEEFEKLPAKKEFESLYPEVMGKKVILFLGRIHPVKGLDMLAKSFADILKTRKDIHLVIAGPDSNGYKDKIVEKLRGGDALKDTTFTGMLTGNKKLAALSRADLFILPSYSEVLGLSAIEAMACRVPVVVTKGCNFHEVERSGCGVVVEPDTAEISSAIMDLLDDEPLRRDMGEKGLKLAKERFTWNRVCDEFIKVYEKILSERGA